MAKVFRAKKGDYFRLACPQCGSTWSTSGVPDYCPNDNCLVLVTFCTVKWTAREIRRANGHAKVLAKALREHIR